MAAAIDIYQAVLDETSEQLWNREFDALVGCMVYPHDLGTYNKVVTVEEAPVLRDFAEGYRDNLDTLGATAYYRVCQAAEFVEGDAIEGRHLCYVLRGATLVVEPFVSEMRLELVDDRWLGRSIISQALIEDVPINPADPTVRKTS